MQPGTLIGQNVRLIRLLGEGGMGSVWLAEHLTLRTQVAVKFMSEALARDAGARARFSSEAAAAASVKSPHIVQMLDHGVSSGRPFIVMEHLTGETLSTRLERVPRLLPEEMAEIVRQTCKGLAKAHAAGIVHRDIKPENLFLTEEDGELCVKILDFGIARVAGEDTSRTQTGSMIGTPLFMSPEQVKSARGSDARSDLWSLAVVVYRALTGALPFDGETAGAIFIAIDSAKIAAPSSHVPTLGVSIDAWMEKALQRDRDRRYATARDLSDAFIAAVTSPHELPRSSASSLSPISNSSSFASLSAKRKPERRATLRNAVIATMGALTLLIAAAVTKTATSTPTQPSTQTQAPPQTQPQPPTQTSTPTPTPTQTSTSTPTSTSTSTSSPWSAMSTLVPVVSPASLPPAPAPSASVSPPRKKKDRGF